MKKLAAIALALVLCACGGDGGAPGDEIQGKWLMTIGSFCALGFAFHAPTYEIDYMCELQSGAIGMEVELGDYKVVGNTIEFRPTAATCPADVSAGSLGYSVSGDTLNLVARTDAIQLVRVNSMPGGGTGVAVKFGCFAQDGAFTQTAIQPL